MDVVKRIISISMASTSNASPASPPRRSEAGAATGSRLIKMEMMLDLHSVDRALAAVNTSDTISSLSVFVLNSVDEFFPRHSQSLEEPIPPDLAIVWLV